MATPADKNYTNARRSGRTNPDLVEVIDAHDVRHHSQKQSFVSNRADARRAGYRSVTGGKRKKS